MAYTCVNGELVVLPAEPGVEALSNLSAKRGAIRGKGSAAH